MVEDRIGQAAPAYEVGPSHSTPPQLYSKHHSETLLIVISKNSLYSLCVYFSVRTSEHFSNQMLHTQGKKAKKGLAPLNKILSRKLKPLIDPQ